MSAPTAGGGLVEAIRNIVEESTARPEPVEGVEALLSVTTRHDQQHALVNLEYLLAHPRRTHGIVVVSDAPSFAAYYGAHNVKATRIYADRVRSTITAVLNDDAAGDSGGPGWRDHRLELRLDLTDEWKAWAGISGKLLAQTAFAEFIEQHVLDIRDPDGATVLELAQSFQATMKAEFVQGTVLASGERRLVFKENIEAKAGKAGNIDIPRRLELGIAPYDGAEPFAVGALLRYRISDGGLGIGVVLERPELVLKQAFVDVVAAVETATGATILHGRPAEPR